MAVLPPRSPDRRLLGGRLSEQQDQLVALGEFKQRALSQIAAQQLEIQRLREALAAQSNLRALPRAQQASAPYGSGS
ncbi:hypothetical protein AB0D71_46515 [Streptomyces avermitilis]|uniref:hypothetical protein n=1 Tax=Streptomyces avermitilis TaxID=33903 RepID=UPI0033F22AB6